MVDTSKKHRGQVVRQKVNEIGISIKRLQELMGRGKTAVYADFENEKLPWERLARYGTALKYDFSHDFPEMRAYISDSLVEELRKAESARLDQAANEIDRWKTEAYTNLKQIEGLKDRMLVLHEYIQSLQKWATKNKLTLPAMPEAPAAG